MDIGTWYYPNHWPRERWESDIESMADAGFEWVRTGVYYWSTVEPHRGAFETDWLNDALDLYNQYGLKTVFGTPTGAPPKWLIDDRPSILQEEPDGTPREFGSRRHYCYNSPAYREETKRMVAKLVDHLAGHPAIAGWQIDNEYGHHDTVECYCDDCKTAFRDWLRDRYGDIETLNAAWGNMFWSQRHDSFEEIDPPGPTPTGHHPSRRLDYRRFSGDSIADYNRLQADIVRSTVDEWFVTTNFPGTGPPMFDDSRLMVDLDVTSWDCYPHHQPGDSPGPTELLAGDPATIGLKHDYHRGLDDGPLWVMELQASDIMGPSPYEPPEGAARLWAHFAAAHGTDVSLYYRYRRSREGQEQFWGALMRHDGSPDRAFSESKRAAAELAEIDERGPVPTEAAILHDYDSQFAMNHELGGAEMSYWDHLGTYHRALRNRGVGVDVRPIERVFEDYDVVVASVYLLDETTADRLASYAADGGELILTARTGVKDRSNKLLNELPPGPLADVASVRVEQHEKRPEDLETRVRYDGSEYEFRSWGEWLTPAGATVLGKHLSEAAAGEPAITRETYGDGAVTYCGVWPSDDLAADLTGEILNRADIEILPRLPRGVHVTERGRHTWVTNFGSEPVTVDGPADDAFVIGAARVPGVDLAVVRGSRGSLSVSDNQPSKP